MSLIPKYIYVCGYWTHKRHESSPYLCKSKYKTFSDHSKCIKYFNKMKSKNSYNNGCNYCNADIYESIHDKCIMLFEYIDGKSTYQCISVFTYDFKLPEQEYVSKNYHFQLKQKNDNYIIKIK